MIERLVIRNHLSFEACDVVFEPGLIVFTGPSGAGKSLFMQALLSVFGHAEVLADRVECTVNAPLNLEAFGYDNDEIAIFKCTKAKQVRYFINDQSSAKKSMTELSKTFLNYLCVKDPNEFDSERLLALIDRVCAKEDAVHAQRLEHFTQTYETYCALTERLKRFESDAKAAQERIEFIRFEVEKIEAIAPQKGEDETLLALKKSLSKKEKIEHALHEASLIFSVETNVHEALSLLEIDATFLDEAMNTLRLHFERAHEKLEALADTDVEALLERIEKIASLKKRYGSVEEALSTLDRKKAELSRYEVAEYDKEALEKQAKSLHIELETLAQQLSHTRRAFLNPLQERLNAYLQALYMPELQLVWEEIILGAWGKDAVRVHLGNVDVKRISSGEYNRLRLAFLATYHSFLHEDSGVLVLDEIDANLSGKESMSVANVLKELSSRYQIFAISHQPQLSSCADQHFLISKDTLHVSHVRKLEGSERLHELARMISGEEVHPEALNYAKTLLESNRS